MPANPNLCFQRRWDTYIVHDMIDSGARLSRLLTEFPHLFNPWKKLHATPKPTLNCSMVLADTLELAHMVEHQRCPPNPLTGHLGVWRAMVNLLPCSLSVGSRTLLTATQNLHADMLE